MKNLSQFLYTNLNLVCLSSLFLFTLSIKILTLKSSKFHTNQFNHICNNNKIK